MTRTSPLGRLLVFAAVGLAAAALYLLLARPAPKPGLSFEAPPATTEQPAPRAASIGAPAPDFTLRSFDGKAVRLADYRGRALVINFWASWCAPCRVEAPIFDRMYRTYRDRGVAFLGVDIQQDDLEDAAAFAQEFRIRYTLARDGDGRVGTAYRIVSLPTTYFIDRRGIVRDRYVGGFLGSEGAADLERRIRALLR